jgi:DNA-binding MarR family transcriptional regulator
MMQSPDPFVLAMQQWVDIVMHHSMRNLFRYIKSKGLTMPQIGAMFHASKGTTNVSHIGDDMGVTSAAASQVLERLVQSGLIIRSEDPNDRRVKQIMLTETGQQLLQDSIHARVSWMNKLSDTLAPDEKEQVLGAINILIKRTEQLASDSD